MEYNLKYQHIKPAVINAVKKVIIEDRIFKRTHTERFIILDRLLNKLCEIYNIPEDKKPKLLLTTFSDGFYNMIDNSINLNDKLSLITLLHEFKHFLQIANNKPNSEDIARGYSISLFYLASEKHFNRAIRKGLIFHQK